MPADDGTGPTSFGPMTGRGAGHCASFAKPGYMNPMSGRGRGRGWRHGCFLIGVPDGRSTYGAPPQDGAASSEHEAQALRAQVRHLEGTLDQIRRRLAEFEAA